MSANILGIDLNGMGGLRQQIEEYKVNANILKDYLYNLHILVQPSQQIQDKVNQQGAPFGDGFLTDGYWIVPFEAATYITRYAMAVPVEFLFHAQQVGGAPPRPDDNRMYQLWEELQDFLRNGGNLYGPAIGPINNPAQPQQPPMVQQPPEPQTTQEAFHFSPPPEEPQQVVEPAGIDQTAFPHDEQPEEIDPYTPLQQPEESLVEMPSPQAALEITPILPEKPTISDRERLRSLLNQLEQEEGTITQSQSGETFSNIVQEFVENNEGFSDNQCSIIVGVADSLLQFVPHEALTMRERVKKQEEKKYEIETVETYEETQNMILTKMGASHLGGIEKTATPEGWINIDPINASRVAAAEIVGKIAASAHLADTSPEWREMQFGWGWEENLFYAISVTLDSHRNTMASFHINGSGFQYK